MMSTETTCKLCLKYFPSEGYAALDEIILQKLEFLKMNLNSSNEESNSICKECEQKIERAFDFKSCLVNATESAETFTTPSTDDSSGEKIRCHLCKILVDKECVISLTKLLKDDSMVEVFQGHIQEVDLENFLENSMVCEVCQKSLASFWSLVSSWLITNDWCENDIKDDFEMVEVKEEIFDDGSLSDSNTNSSCASEVISDNSKKVTNTKKIEGDSGVQIEHVIKGISEADNSVDVKAVKSEEMNEFQLKDEEIDIKNEDGADGGKKSTEGRRQEKIFKCHHCSFQTNQKNHWNRHLNLFNNFDKEKGFECSICDFVTMHCSLFQKHTTLSHKDVRVGPHKCKYCSFSTKRKGNLNRHVLRHFNRKKVGIHKCDICPYETKFRKKLVRHSLTHKTLAEVQVYKCKDCDYVTKYKHHIKSHGIVHVDIKEVKKTYACEICPYVTKYKRSLETHLVKHTIEVYKCNFCTFETKYNRTLKEHALIHLDSNEVLTYKCATCPYETRNKRYLSKHVRRHQRTIEHEATR